jgi:hypothetical protein
MIAVFYMLENSSFAADVLAKLAGIHNEVVPMECPDIYFLFL